jgi:8-oxo-dGTP diphosphatase
MLPAFGIDAGFPLIGCAKIMAQEMLRAGRESTAEDTLKEIVICLFSDEVYKVFDRQVYGYLRHVMEDMAWGPYVTTDIIIEVGDGIILIERTNPPFGWALPGGFVDYGESLETAARREAKEETAMDLADLKQFHIYSDPTRDPRFHTVTTVFTAKGIGTPCAGDDAKGLKIVPLTELRKLSYAFDHNQVIDDYLKSRGM